MSLAKRVAANSIYQLVGKAATLLLSLIMVAFLTRNLGVGAYGVYTIALTFSQLFAIIADGGLGIYLLKKLSAAQVLGTKEKHILGLVTEVRVATAVVGALIALSLTLFLPYSNSVRYAVAVALVAVIVQMVNALYVVVLQSQLEMRYASFSETAGRIVMLIGVYLAIRAGQGVSGVLVAQIFGNLVNLLITVVLASRFLRPQFDWETRKWPEVIRSSFLIGFSSVIAYIYFKTDTFLLSILHIPGKINSIEVGLYGSAYKVVDNLIIIPGIIIGTIFPLLAGALARKEEVKARLLVGRTFDVMLGIGLAACGGLTLFAKPLIHLIAGNTFAPAAVPLSILAFAIPLNFVGAVFCYALLALERQRVMTYLYAIAAVFNITANVLLIPHYSYVAAAWTTAATELIVTTGSYILVRDVFPLRPSASGTGAIVLGVAAASLLPLLVSPSLLLVRVILYVGILGITFLSLRSYLLTSPQSGPLSS